MKKTETLEAIPLRPYRASIPHTRADLQEVLLSMCRDPFADVHIVFRNRNAEFALLQQELLGTYKKGEGSLDPQDQRKAERLIELFAEAVTAQLSKNALSGATVSAPVRERRQEASAGTRFSLGALFARWSAGAVKWMQQERSTPVPAHTMLMSAMADAAEVPQMLEPPETMEELNQLLSLIVNPPYRDLRLILLDTSDEFRDLERFLLSSLTEEPAPLPAKTRTFAARLIALLNGEIRTADSTRIAPAEQSGIRNRTWEALRSVCFGAWPRQIVR
jgi:hypothetical protein